MVQFSFLIIIAHVYILCTSTMLKASQFPAGPSLRRYMYNITLHYIIELKVCMCKMLISCKSDAMTLNVNVYMYLASNCTIKMRSSLALYIGSSLPT